MSFPNRFAILVDGEWLKKALQGRSGNPREFFPSVSDIIGATEEIKQQDGLQGSDLYRIFYYTANPLAKTLTNPIDKTRENFGEKTQFKKNAELIDKIENLPNFAVRRGELGYYGWTLRNTTLKRLQDGDSMTLTASDVKPNIRQKGVDMMIGIDMTALALKRLVSTVVVVSGDSDLVPALKLARTEGLKVYVALFGKGRAHGMLIKHTDRIFNL